MEADDAIIKLSQYESQLKQVQELLDFDDEDEN